jgi:acyl-CoA thioester hydrolase
MPRHRVFTALRWSDMDAYGHINNVQFLRLLEDARVFTFGAQGAPGGGSLLSTGLIVGRQEIEYLEPLVFRAQSVAIDLWVTAIGGADFDLGYEIRDPDPGDPVFVHTTEDAGAAGSAAGNGAAADDAAGNGAGERLPADSAPPPPASGGGQIYARAETMQVVYDLATSRPRRITPEERERLEGMRDEPVAWRRRRRSRT